VIAEKVVPFARINEGGEIEGGAPPLVPEGNYSLRFDTWSTCLMWGRQPKVVLSFTVTDYGPHFGTRLQRWYNVTRVIGKPGPKGRFKAGFSSDLLRELAACCRPASRPDRVALTAYADRLVIGQVETVKRDSRQRAIPEVLWRSVIRSLGPGKL
jgi:hypothetical protein